MSQRFESRRHIPLVAETGATGPGILQGFVTAKTAPAVLSST